MITPKNLRYTVARQLTLDSIFHPGKTGTPQITDEEASVDVNIVGEQQ